MLIDYRKRTKVTVVDDIMGSGKTSWAIQHMNKAPKHQRFIFITPFLTEITRVKKATRRRFKDPTNRNNKGSKLQGLKHLLKQGADICTTHALFKEFDQEVLDLLYFGNYTLILDEVAEVIEVVNITGKDVEMLLKSEVVSVDSSTGLVSWIDTDYEGKFKGYKHMIETKKVFMHQGTVFIWTFPIEVFEAVREVYVLTYLFDGQIQKHYFDMHGLDYVKKSVAVVEDNHTLAMTVVNGEMTFRVVPKYGLIEHRQPDVSHLKELIHLCNDSKLNSIGRSKNKLGHDGLTFTQMKRLKKSDTKAKAISKNLYNWFRHKNGVKVDSVMWTCPKDVVKVVSPRGYKQGFVSSSMRATNEFQDRTVVAYMLNRYMNPVLVGFFESKGIEVDQDMYALSELLQWLFRSAIRNGETIELYLPSERMRTLLEGWLNN